MTRFFLKMDYGFLGLTNMRLGVLLYFALYPVPCGILTNIYLTTSITYLTSKSSPISLAVIKAVLAGGLNGT